MPTFKNESILSRGNAYIAHRSRKSQLFTHHQRRSLSVSNLTARTANRPKEEALYEDVPTGKKLKAGTLAYLVEQLTTTDDQSDNSFTNTFLLTWPTFTSPEQLLSKLKDRFLAIPPNGYSTDQANKWREHVQRQVRMRVINFVKRWVEVLDESALANATVVQTISEFITLVEREGLEYAARQLYSLVDKATALPGWAPKRINTPTSPINEHSVELLSGAPRPKLTIRTRASKRAASHKPPPAVILPKSLDRISLLQIDPLEMARQLTLLEWALWVNVRPCHLLKGAWSKSESNSVRQVIDLSNRMTFWVASTILSQQDIKQRCLLVKHFILVADRCRGLNNFNSLMSILAALNSAPVSRLSRTWDALSTKAQGYLKSMQALMSPEKNFSRYRVSLASIVSEFNASEGNPTPCIPFLGMYLTDLTMIEDGNKDYITSTTPSSSNEWQCGDIESASVRPYVSDNRLGTKPPASQTNTESGGSLNSELSERPLSSPSLINTPTSASDIVSAYIDSYFPNVETEEPALSNDSVLSAVTLSPVQTDSEPQLINWVKRQLTATVLLEVQMLQSEPFNLSMVPELQQYLQLALQEDATAVSSGTPSRIPTTPIVMSSSPDGLAASSRICRVRGASLSVPTSPLAQPSALWMSPLHENKERLSIDDQGLKSKPRLRMLNTSTSHQPVSSGGSWGSMSSSSSILSSSSSSSASMASAAPSSKPSPSYLKSAVPTRASHSFCRSSPAGTSKEKDLYELSLDIEPRERTDEKITRLLHESGFL